jgi:hypothetical protein
MCLVSFLLVLRSLEQISSDLKITGYITVNLKSLFRMVGTSMLDILIVQKLLMPNSKLEKKFKVMGKEPPLLEGSDKQSELYDISS